jgi:hypothetical protein
MTDFVTALGGGSEKRWLLAGKTVLAAVVLTCVSGLGVIVAAAVHAHEAGKFYKEASDFYAADNMDSFAKSDNLAHEKAQLFLSTESILLYCHAAVLLFIVAAFLVTGALSVRHMNSMLRGAAASSVSSATGRSVRVQILATTTFVFLTFLLRSIDATLYAVASGLNDVGNACPNFESYCDPNCYNTYTHILNWMAFTPEYSPIIVLISAPITLLVALWGMTSKFTFHQLTKSHQEEKTAISRSMARM